MTRYRINFGYGRDRNAISALLVAVLSLPLCARGAEAAKDGKVDQHHNEIKLSKEVIAKYGITLEPIRRHALIPTFTAPARVAFNAEAMAHVGAVIRGRAVELKVRRGDTVKKGDPLVVVESPELGEAQSDLLQKRTAAEIAGPAEALAKDAYERAKKLYDESQGIALTELQKRQADYQTATGSLKSAQAAVVAAENRLHLLGMTQGAVESLVKSGEVNPQYTITAPIAGQVTEREITLGELVNPDKEALLVIANTESLWVLADVPEARTAEVRIGANAFVRVAAGSRPYEGKVSFIEPSLDPNTRTGRVRIEVTGAATQTMRPGMFAQTEIELASGEGKAPSPQLAVPDEAVQTVDGATVVFVPVAGEEGTFAKRPVAVGPATGGMLPIISGLKEGDPVVTNGSFVMKAELGKSAAEED